MKNPMHRLMKYCAKFVMENGETMLKLRNQETLSFNFPDNGYEGDLKIRFDRIIRVPDGEIMNKRAFSLEHFPLELVDDHTQRIPSEMKTRGGVMLPMHPYEAMAISFSGGFQVPFAVKIGAGKINVLSGGPWFEELIADQQDYIVVAGSACLDGFYVDRGMCRQFVAVPLGQGQSIEEQITGLTDVGGLQIAVYPMKAELAAIKLDEYRYRLANPFPGKEMRMGLAMNGKLDQRLLVDRFGVSTWDVTARLRCFVHLISSEHWRDLTKKRAPRSPITARDYRRAGLPMDSTYAHSRVSMASSLMFSGLKTVTDTMASLFSGDDQDTPTKDDGSRVIQPDLRNSKRMN